LNDISYTYRLSLVNNTTNLSEGMSASPFLASPTILPNDRMIYKDGKKIEIIAPVDGAEICYTLDGTEPSESSAIYKEPIQISKSCVVKAKTYKKGENTSLSVAHYYNIGEILYESPVIKYGDQPIASEVSIEGFSSFGILITDPDNSIDWDHSDILEPVLVKRDGSEMSLTELKPYITFQSWNSLVTNRSVDRNPLKVAGTVYKKGLGTHCLAEIWYHSDFDLAKIKLMVGVDDETEKRGSSTISYCIVGIR
jgi:hypothetical protein